MEVVGAKVVVLILLGLIKFGAGLLPVLLDKVLQRKKIKWMEKFMSGMLCVGGGVLLATVFIHMIPEVRESFETARKLNNSNEQESEDEHNHSYPLAELVVCAGFFIIYLIEALVNHIFGIDHNHGHSHGAKPKTEVQNVENGGIVNMGFNDTTNNGPMRSPPDTPNTTAETDATPKTICSPQISQDNHPDNVDATISPFGFKYKCSSPSKLVGPRNVYNVSSATLTSYTSYSDGDSLDASLPNHLGLPVVKQKKSKTSLGARAREKKILASIRNFLIVLALSIHSVFEGMAIGLQLNVSDVWKLFAAISIHAVAILFSIGAEMVTSGTKRIQIIFYMVTLSLVTPIGVIIGMVITEYADEQSATQIFIIGLLQGLAGGTLLYITFFEVLDREKLRKLGLTSLYGCFLLILGFGVMAGLEAAGAHSHGIMKHDHDHGHDHGHASHHLHPIIVDQEQLKQIDPRLPDILKHHNHDHENDHNHEHEENEHGEHDHPDHNEHDRQHQHDEHNEHDHDEHNEHDHDEHNEHDHEHDIHNDHDEHNEQDHEHDIHNDHDEHNEHKHDHDIHNDHDEHNDHDHEHDIHNDHDEHNVHDHEHDEPVENNAYFPIPIQSRA